MVDVGNDGDISNFFGVVHVLESLKNLNNASNLIDKLFYF